MDKYEYKIRSEEIKALIVDGDYAEAAIIADSIDWRRVKSVMMLCTVSDLYKINRRFEDSRDMLLLAYERHPGGRSIVYSLCELSIKMEEFVQAVEYYKEFVQIAPKDSGRYILQYKLYEAQDVSLEERIAVLEELKAKDYSEKWAYELAYLYHRVGLATRCVEECDELILWFGEGKYVLKAMELKMLHEGLNPDQQEKYNIIKGVKSTVKVTADTDKHPVEDDEMDEPTKEILSKELDIQVKLMGVGQYDTINMQKELAENMKELWEGTEVALEDASALDTPDEEPEEEQIEETKMEEVFFGETADLDSTASQVLEEMKTENQNTEEIIEDGIQAQFLPIAEGMLEVQLQEPAIASTAVSSVESAEAKTKYEKILGMEYDGQISLLLPESEKIEKQITGQIKLEDILIEWERMKKDSEQKRMEAVRQRVLEHTGAMFTEYEASIRDGLLEQLEGEKADTEESVQETVAEVELEETEELEEIEEIEELEEADELEEAEELEEADELEEIDELEEPEEPEELDEVEEPVFDDEEETEEAVEAIVETEEIKEEKPVQEKKIRSFSPEERELFSSYAQSESTKEQIIHAIDSISMASYTGNVILTGDEGMDILTLAKNLVKEVQSSDNNFSGKIAKISGASLEKKEIEETLTKLSNGALIVQGVLAISKETANKLNKALEQENRGIIILLMDTKKNMNKFLQNNHILTDRFNIRVDVEALDDDSLVQFAKKYALDKEYSIDEMGVLALHTRISDMQTLDHAVTVAEIRDIIDEAIYQANKKSIGHFFDTLIGKRYDEEDMIILRENDFI